MSPINLYTEAAYLHQLAEALKNTPREGEKSDTPEGARYIKISDTLANNISNNLEMAVLAMYTAMDQVK